MVTNQVFHMGCFTCKVRVGVGRAKGDRFWTDEFRRVIVPFVSEHGDCPDVRFFPQGGDDWDETVDDSWLRIRGVRRQEPKVMEERYKTVRLCGNIAGAVDQPTGFKKKLAEAECLRLDGLTRVRLGLGPDEQPTVLHYTAMMACGHPGGALETRHYSGRRPSDVGCGICRMGVKYAVTLWEKRTAELCLQYERQLMATERAEAKKAGGITGLVQVPLGDNGQAMERVLLSLAAANIKHGYESIRAVVESHPELDWASMFDRLDATMQARTKDEAGYEGHGEGDVCVLQAIDEQLGREPQYFS